MSAGENRPSEAVVGVGYGQGAYGNIRAALAAVDLSFARGRSVLIKPNVGRVAPPNCGINVSSEAVAACVDAFREAGASRIAVGESPITGVRAEEAFASSGLTRVAQERGVPLLDLDAGGPTELLLKPGAILPRVLLCRTVCAFDLRVSLAVMKTHMHTGVSLSVKNLKGFLYRRQKVAFHQLRGGSAQETARPLDVAISDLAVAFPPHVAVIDGWIGLEGLGPSAGNPRKANLAVASTDAVAADAVACRLMGLDPREVSHLRLAAEKRAGVLEAGHIHTVPAYQEDWIKPFQRPPETLTMAFPDVVVYEAGACSACLSTALVFLQRYRERLTPLRLQDGRLHLVIGSDTGDVPNGTIVIGNCAARHRRRGPFAKGCPPVGSAIFRVITGRLPDQADPDR